VLIAFALSKTPIGPKKVTFSIKKNHGFIGIGDWAQKKVKKSQKSEKKSIFQ